MQAVSGRTGRSRGGPVRGEEPDALAGGLRRAAVRVDAESALKALVESGGRQIAEALEDLPARFHAVKAVLALLHREGPEVAGREPGRSFAYAIAVTSLPWIP